MAHNQIGMDLGTTSVIMASPQQGVLFSGPSVVAVDKRTNKIIAIGEQALAMTGRVPDFIAVIRPLKDGVISNHDLTAEMIRYFMSEVQGGKSAKPRVTVCVPAAITGVEQDAVVSAVMEAGAKQVCLLDEPMAAAMGCGVDVTAPRGSMVIDVGGGTTDVAVLSMGGKVCAASVPAGGNAMDEEIVRYMRVHHSLAIGLPTAEQMKKSIACCVKNSFSENMEVKGRSLTTGLPQRIIMNTVELYDVVGGVAAQIAAAARQVLERTPPELAGDIAADGVRLTGGVSQLQGLDEYLQQALKMEMHRTEAPQNCVALGAAQSFALAGSLQSGYSDATARAFKLRG